MHIISSCITIALTRGLDRVMLGVHGTDAANYHYPDCTPAFIGAMAAACEIGNSGQVQLEAPFNTWSKGDIVAYAAELKAPAALTQSCYSGVRPQCGKCATCHERIAAFTEAGFIDPAPYAIEIRWDLSLKMWPVNLSTVSAEKMSLQEWAKLSNEERMKVHENQWDPGIQRHSGSA
jgi:hypothetical protein